MLGRVVKGVQFVDLIDAGDPVQAATAYDAAGADELCFLDIAASVENRGTLLDVVQRTAEQCFMPLTVGGGVRQVADIRALLLAGADKVSINTSAVKRPEFVREAAQKFGSQCITVAIDVTHGGRTETGIDAVAFAQQVESLGAGEILLTSMDRDGAKIGYDIALTRAISDAVGIPVIASGGVGELEHLAEALRHLHDCRGETGDGRRRCSCSALILYHGLHITSGIHYEAHRHFRQPSQSVAEHEIA